MISSNACVCRNYSVVNVEKGQMDVKRMSCPGSRISCQMKMGSTLWMATEVHTTQAMPFEIIFYANKSFSILHAECCLKAIKSNINMIISLTFTLYLELKLLFWKQCLTKYIVYRLKTHVMTNCDFWRWSKTQCDCIQPKCKCEYISNQQTATPMAEINKC